MRSGWYQHVSRVLIISNNLNILNHRFVRPANHAIMLAKCALLQCFSCFFSPPVSSSLAEVVRNKACCKIFCWHSLTGSQPVLSLLKWIPSPSHPCPFAPKTVFLPLERLRCNTAILSAARSFRLQEAWVPMSTEYWGSCLHLMCSHVWIMGPLAPDEAQQPQMMWII